MPYGFGLGWKWSGLMEGGVGVSMVRNGHGRKRLHTDAWDYKNVGVEEVFL